MNTHNSLTARPFERSICYCQAQQFYLKSYYGRLQKMREKSAYGLIVYDAIDGDGFADVKLVHVDGFCFSVIGKSESI